MPLTPIARRHLTLACQLLAACLLGALTCGLLAATLPSVGAWARDAVPLTFTRQHPRLQDLRGLFAHNARTVCLPLLGALAMSWLNAPSRTLALVRVLLDALLGVGLASNVTLLTVAVAGYGPQRLARWLPHLPAELAGLSVALAAYVLARRQPLTRTHLLFTASLSLLLVLIAAALETYAVPHR
jgi:hypothetical protein